MVRARMLWSGSFKWKFFVICVCISGFGLTTALAQTAADCAVRASAFVYTNPPQISLCWPYSDSATQYKVSKRTVSAPSLTWVDVVTLSGSVTGYVDTAVALGTPYEYRIQRSASCTGYSYLYAGIDVPMTDYRGTIILIVDNTMTAELADGLARLENDLVGDGWEVLRHDVGRGDSVESVKSLIVADYNSDPENVNTVFLFGHVPVPYSGRLNPDGHGDHRGAWPADPYYGDMDGDWTDYTVDDSSASSSRNHNVPGDGKFDQTSLTGANAVELQVGRVDLWGLSSFSSEEVSLLRRYLNKDHNFRHKIITAQDRGLVDDNFGYMGGEAFASCGWRDFAAFFGAANTAAEDWFTTLESESYLWAYGCGAGSYSSCSGVGSTANFAASDPQVIFTMLLGSYFGDWDSANNLMRAAIATPTYTLTCAWSGRPHWHFHHMALGKTTGFSTRLSQNNHGAYTHPRPSVHVALMGDPSLRMHVVAPASNLRITSIPLLGNAKHDLQWNASSDSVVGYHVFRADSSEGPYTRLTDDPVEDTSYSDTTRSENPWYMVRAIKLQSSASGTYYNPSQGIFSRASVNPRESLYPLVYIEIPTAGAVYSTTNSAIILAGTMYDEVSVTQVVWRTAAGASGVCKQLSDTEWRTDPIDLAEGENFIYVTAVNNINYTFTDTITIVREANTSSHSSARNDYDQDGRSDLAVYCPLNGKWYIRSCDGEVIGMGIDWGIPGPVADHESHDADNLTYLVPEDYDGDEQTDIGVYEATEGKWYVQSLKEGAVLAWSLEWGGAGQIPVSRDYDGDGKADFAVFEPETGLWKVWTWRGDRFQIQFGWSATIPVPNDYDGDGLTDFAVYHPESGCWYIWTWAGAYYVRQFGWSDARPVSGDYDGDGAADMAVFDQQNGEWHIYTWQGVYRRVQFGWSETVPVPGDYDGDGKTDLAVYHQAAGMWYIWCWSGDCIPVSWGWSEAVPVRSGL